MCFIHLFYYLRYFAFGKKRANMKLKKSHLKLGHQGSKLKSGTSQLMGEVKTFERDYFLPKNKFLVRRSPPRKITRNK